MGLTETVYRNEADALMAGFFATSDPAERERIQARIAEIEREDGVANVGRADRTRWCDCPTTDGATSYYQAADGPAHGFFHDPAQGGCGGITQTG